MNQQASILPQVELALDRADARQQESMCQRLFDEADATFGHEPTEENFEARAMARTRLGRASNDVQDPEYNRPEVVGFVRREHQVTVPAVPRKVSTPRRVPRSRGAAHRPGARAAARAGPSPGDDPDDDEPPLAAATAGRAP
jgi:hypothetical protein